MKKFIGSFAVIFAAIFLLSGCTSGIEEISGNSSVISGTGISGNTSKTPSSSSIEISEIPEIPDNPPEIPKTPDITAMEFVRNLGFGINLGNTFESCGDWINSSEVSVYETAWGSPVITRSAIQGYADAGFGVLRIPAAWSNLMSTDGNYTIDRRYIERVREVAGWALDSGMYAVINLHYDGGWINKFPENEEENMRRFTLIWQQLAEAFGDFDERLIFEAQNEELGWDSIWNHWSSSSNSSGEEKSRSYALVNRVNQTFVDVIRASGGNNSRRLLLIPGYNTDIELTCDELFKMPDDPAGRLAVSVHYYDPTTLTILESDADWGKAKTDWGSPEDIAELDRKISLLKTRFIDRNIPVIAGEYGCFGNNKSREVIESYLLDVSSRLYSIGACPVLWDTCGGEYDRTAGMFRRPEFIKRLIIP